MNQSDQLPLVGDPDREAGDAIGGFDHQIWRTILEWLELPADQVLYVEGAEDLDQRTPGVARTMQIKRVAKSVTLSSVLDAVVDFWGHRKNNPREEVHFSYVTTAGRGYERDRPFGKVRGLDHWDMCRVDGADLTSLRTFLSRGLTKLKRAAPKKESTKNRERREARNALIEELLSFLDQSGDALVRDQLIRRMVWDTAGPNQAEMEARARRHLVAYGESIPEKLFPRDSEQVLAHLYRHAWSVAQGSAGERWLRRADWQRIFERETMTLVPRSLARTIGGGGAGLAGGSILAPPDQSAVWYIAALKRLHTAARHAFVEGRHEEARRDLEALLGQLRGGDEPADPTRRDFEQGILLSLAQVAFREGDEELADKCYREALSLGELHGRNRYYAGWVLVNLGRPAEAIKHLQPAEPEAEWRTTLAIAFLSEGDLEGYRALFGDERNADEPDVLSALVLHFAAKGEAVRADFYARRLLARDAGEPIDRVRAIEAGTRLVELFAWSLTREPVEFVSWVGELRRLFADSDRIMATASPDLRRSVLFRRLGFHRTLMEMEHASAVYQLLVEEAPAMAASAAAAGMSVPTAGQADAILSASRDPFEATLVEALVASMRGDLTTAASRLRAAIALSDERNRDIAEVRLIDLEAEAGTRPESLIPRVASIRDPQTRALVHADLLTSARRNAEAASVLRTALEERPQSLRLLAGGLTIIRTGVDQEPNGGEAASLIDFEMEIATRLVERLPCPESRIALSITKARRGELDAALDDVRDVEAAGYQTRGTVSLIAELSHRLLRLTEYASATRRLYEDYDHSLRSGMRAAEAAIRARDWEGAQAVLRSLLNADDRTSAVRAYRALAFVVDAQGTGVAAARDEAVRVLLEGYDRLGGPVQLAGPLYFYALGTCHARAVHERIARDHGSFANLPGVVSVPIEQAAEMMRRDDEGAKARSRMLALGALPFEAFANLSPRRTAYLWFAYRSARNLLLVDPPRFLVMSRTEPFADEAPRPLLLERTALLMLAETQLMEVVLRSPLALLVGRETVDWLEEEGRTLQSEYRPLEHDRLRAQMSALESLSDVWTVDRAVDEAAVAELREAVPWIHAYEIALAQRDGALLVDDYVDLNELPEAIRDVVVRSGDLLLALLSTGALASFELAAAAERENPAAFRRSRPSRPVELQRPILLTSGALNAWHGTDLLKVLGGAVTQLKVTPAAEHGLRSALIEHDAHHAALVAVGQLWAKLAPAIESGRVSVVDAPPGYAAVSPDDDLDDEEDESPEGGERLAGILDAMTAPLQRTYAQAITASALVWTDDAATRLYLDYRGPLISEEPGEFRRRIAEIFVKHAGLRAVGTAEIALWLEQHGFLTSEERKRVLADLISHGRAFLMDAGLIAASARTYVQGKATPVINSLESLPGLLDEEAVKRFAPWVATMIAEAVNLVWADLHMERDLREAILRRLLQASRPWMSSGSAIARLTARMFWLEFLTELIRHASQGINEMVALVRAVLDAASEEPESYQALLSTLWVTVEFLYESAEGADEQSRAALGTCFAMIADAAQNFVVNGRPVLPMEVVKLVDTRFRLGINWHMTAEGERDGHPVRVQYDPADGATQAVGVLNDLASSDPVALDNFFGNARGLRIAVPARVWEEGREYASSVDVEVDLLLILDRVAPPVRRAAAVALSNNYRAAGAPELALLLDQQTEALASSISETALQAIDAVASELLKNARFWAEHDVYHAFVLLLEAPLEHLRAMAGDPEPWHSGEDLAAWSVRVQRGLSDAEDVWSHFQGITGPYRPNVFQWLELATKGTDAATESELRALISNVLFAEPYARVVALLGTFLLLDRRPDLACLPVRALKTGDDPAEDGQRWSYAGTYAELVRKVLLGWLAGEIGNHPANATPIEPDGETNFLNALVKRHIHEMKVTAGVTRLVFRAVLSERHWREAVAAAEQREGGDPVGDLLLLGQLLVSAMLQPILGQSVERDILSVLQEVELAATQTPLSEGRLAVGELFTPEVIGVGADSVNPFLALLLAGLELGWPAFPPEGENSDPEGMIDNSRSPVWWSPSIATALQVLADREPPASVAFQQNLAQRQDIQDRFGTLLAEGIQAQAARLLKINQPQSSSPSGDGAGPPDLENT